MTETTWSTSQFQFLSLWQVSESQLHGSLGDKPQLSLSEGCVNLPELWLMTDTLSSGSTPLCWRRPGNSSNTWVTPELFFPSGPQRRDDSLFSERLSQLDDWLTLLFLRSDLKPVLLRCWCNGETLPGWKLACSLIGARAFWISSEAKGHETGWAHGAHES